MPNDLPDRLLPCPFCGSATVHGHYTGTHDFVECYGCGVTGARHIHKSSYEATKAWNTRANTAKPIVEKLVSELKMARNRVDYLGKEVADWKANVGTFLPRIDKAIAEGTAWLNNREDGNG